MSNRNFDSRVIIQRLQNKNYARNLYQQNVDGERLINNPQNSDGNSSRYVTFVPGAQTEYYRTLEGTTTINLGGTFGISFIPPSTAPVPAPPSAPTITSITPGNTALTVNFTPPTSVGSSPIIYYEYSINGGSTYFPTRTANSPVIIGGLINGTSYDIVIRAVNLEGPGLPSNIVSAIPS
jgi:hypothetical protein|uniref:Fibronectin type-III domain-containing protein n=1 Tax=viral metagenome TaxID=1070528 RepID=A0A6C0BI64_9ZZZZ